MKLWAKNGIFIEMDKIITFFSGNFLFLNLGGTVVNKTNSVEF